MSMPIPIDKVFTIALPDSDLIFTRYLYVKDEVKLALLMSILEKKDESVFWAYEIYYSGFPNELFAMLWQIYYDFFATLNPTFEAYFYKKHSEWLLNKNDCIVSCIVQDLLYRPFNTDIFFLRTLTTSFQIDVEYAEGVKKITHTIDFRENMKHWFKTDDYRSLAQWILYENKCISKEEIYKSCLEIFETNGVKESANTKKMKNAKTINISKINENVLLLTKIMTLFSKSKQLKKGRSLYITVEPEEIAVYQCATGVTTTIAPYNILPTVAIYGIDDLKWLGLFKLKRNKYNLPEKYWRHWEYHAYFSPLWFQRIMEYGGYPDYDKKTIEFSDDDELERFYANYGLEPDEQKKDVQEKSIMPIDKIKTWHTFYDTFKKNGLLEVYEEELEELDCVSY